MRQTLTAKLFSLLAAAALGIPMAVAAARQGEVGLEGGMDGPKMGFQSGSGGKIGPEQAAQRLARIETKIAQVQAQFSVKNNAQTAPMLQAILDQTAKAREFLAAGNYLAVNQACDAIDRNIGQMLEFFNSNSISQNLGGGSGPGPGQDFDRFKEDQRNAAQFDIQRDEVRLADLAQLLAVSKNTRAAETLEKARAMVDRARQELASDRPENARNILSQVEPIFLELQRLLQENHVTDNPQGTDPARDKDLQPGVRAALGQATEIYRRVLERSTRLKDQNKPSDDPKTAAAAARIQELLDKAKEALGAGQAEAAKEYGLKAEGLLAELHRTMSAGDARLSPAAWERLKAKLERAAAIVASSGNDKASRILEKGREHFERAQRSQADGQASRAEVEMDLCLKLAAKAVDIARSGPR
jgi:hypothetical protein